jgi:RHS repeat-associated protein
LNRILTENNSSTGGTDITYLYDSCTNGTGQLCSVVTPDITTNYTYLKQGLVGTESKLIDTVTYATNTDYNRQGSVTKVTHPNASFTDYEYNTRVLVDNVKYNGTSLVTADYGVHGRPIAQVHANGVSSTYTYDAGELYELTNKTTTDGTIDFQDLSYSYDSVGNIASIVDGSDTNTAKTQSFTYDDLYRLTSTGVTGSANTADYSRNYSYSPIGNITAFDGITYSYTDSGYSNPHAVTNIGGIAYTYDNNGNLTNDGTWNHSWDYRNRLASSTDGTATSSYEYDSSNQRIKLIEGSDTTIYPTGDYEIKNGDVKVSFNLADTLVATDDNGTINHVHTDHLGGTNITTDTARAITQTLDYFPYGDNRIDTGTDNEKKQFTGYTKDASTGLNYAGARYYSGKTGRFISQDPVGLFNPTKLLTDPQLFNTYSYARNNPIKYNDPTGMIPDDPGESLKYFFVGIGDTVYNTGKGLYELAGIVSTAAYDSEARQQLSDIGSAAVDGTISTAQGAASEISALVTSPGQTFSEYGQAYEATSNETFGRAMGNLTLGAMTEVASARLLKGAGAAANAVDNVPTSRFPKSIQDQMTLQAAYDGAYTKNLTLDRNLKLDDSNYEGMNKMQYSTTSANGNISNVHYVSDPATGMRTDFKFNKHSTEPKVRKLKN